MSDTAKIIEQYNALIQRAHDVVDKEPFWTYVSEPGLSRLTIEDDTATLTIAELERGSYDEGDSLSHKDISFPAEMLTWPQDRFAEWEKEMARQYKNKRAAIERADKAQREAEERAAYEALKRKFEK